MEEYIKILNYAIPGFLILVSLEYLISMVFKNKVYRGFDTISSLSSGLTNSLKDVMGISIVIVSYSWMVSNWAIFEIDSKLWMYAAAFVGLDFAGYWSHRFEHKINLFWNRHIIHHSSEEFNLACALRQPISSLFTIFWFLMLPLALLGVPAIVVATIAPLHLFAQFWYHTKLINKLGPLEFILVTPSHHRVHHAINTEYLDKNFSQIFIVWDRLFGTFQQELKEVPAVYGIKRPAKTWNPILINFQHLWLLMKDAFHSKNWLDKLRIWFMPTGWRPDNVEEVFTIEDVYGYQKYESKTTDSLLLWSWFQLLFHLFLMLYLFNQMASFDFVYIITGALIIALSIFAFTSLMDRSILSLIAEVIKFLAAGVLMFLLSGWFNFDQLVPNGSMIISLYFLISLMATIYFLYFELDDKEKTTLSNA